MQVAAVVAVGLLAGLVGGLFGVGGGVVIVPLLMMAVGFDTKLAVGTSLAAIIPTAIIATVKHHQLGNINWKVVGLLAAGSVFGAFAGASLTAVISSVALKKGFAVLLLLTSLRMLLS